MAVVCRRTTMPRLRTVRLMAAPFSPSYHLHTNRRSFANLFAHEWHRRDFMKNESLQAKQGWLSNLIQDYPAELDAEAYSVVLRAIAQSSHPGSPQQAEELINRMTVPANDECYQAVMKAWANSRREDSSLRIVRAERWFSRIQEPTLESYHILLNVMSKGQVKINNRTRAKQLLIENACKAEEILGSMNMTKTVRPDTQAFNYVIRGWSRVRSDPELSAEKIMEWLTRMERLQQENPAGPIQPNTQSYSMGMECNALLAGHRAKHHQGGGLAELAQVETLLKYMHDLQRDGYPNVVPNTVSYNIVLSTYARLAACGHEDAPLKAETILRRMMVIGKDAAPDYLSFTKIIIAWTNANGPTSGQRAGYWLDKLWELYEEKGHDQRLRPQIGTYNLVIKAWKEDPENAEKVFMQLLRAEKADGEALLRPNTESFSLLIVAWSKFDLSRALMWLEELMRREAEASTDSFSITTTPELFEVLIRRASIEPSLVNLSLGVKTFEYLRASRHIVGVLVYRWLLKLGLRTLSGPQHDEDRQSFLADIIQDCCNDGLVSNVFLRELASGPVYTTGWTARKSRAAVQAYFSDWPMPASWSRNVDEDFHIPQESDTIRTTTEVFHHEPVEEKAIHDAER
jgi:hypothetical protein